MCILKVFFSLVMIDYVVTISLIFLDMLSSVLSGLLWSFSKRDLKAGVLDQVLLVDLAWGP